MYGIYIVTRTYTKQFNLTEQNVINKYKNRIPLTDSLVIIINPEKRHNVWN